MPGDVEEAYGYKSGGCKPHSVVCGVKDRVEDLNKLPYLFDKKDECETGRIMLLLLLLLFLLLMPVVVAYAACCCCQ